MHDHSHVVGMVGMDVVRHAINSRFLDAFYSVWVAIS